MSGPRDRRETPAETLTYWGYRAVQRLAGALPEPVGRALFIVGGRVAFRIAGERRRNVIANLARILGRDPQDALVRATAVEAFELYARYWFDAFRVPTLSPAEVDARMDGAGLDEIDRALERGRGCVVVLGHLGNPDVAASWAARQGYPITAVAERLRPERLFDLFRRQREGYGLTILGTGDPTLKQRLADHLRGNGVVALAADRDLSGRGIPIEMFGATRTLPTGPATLALANDAPLHFFAISTTDRGWRGRVGPALEIARSGDLRTDVRALTERLAREFERAIAANPADWHVLQPGWPAA
ncbi:MAG: phosphatidylinositol mannoside acyltransferase [Actinomycetota bacterium]